MMTRLSLSPMPSHAILVALTAALLLSGCSDDAPNQPNIDAEAAQMLSNYAAISYASYADSLSTAQELDSRIDSFLGSPDAAGLTAAQQAWRDAREPYLLTEVFRFYDGPIDNPDDGPEGLLNAWPLDEAYIDYVEGDPTAGIVNDPSKDITAANLESLNEQGGEENIATGYHAIEFLLWGQDMSASGPGARPHTDYLMGGGADNPDRRGAYLTTVSSMLVGHLEGLVAAWDPAQSGNYQQDFLAVSSSEGLRRVLTGMIILSGFETGGERLQTALDSGDQEDEHSCFSDNTHRDMVQDVQGIQNVYLGHYTSLAGTSISGLGVRDIIALRDATLAAAIEAKIADSLSLAKAIQPPFDQEIVPSNSAGRARVEALIVSLREQEKLLEEAFRLFDLEIPVAE